MKNKIFFVVCLLFGLMFINAGLNKFFDMPQSSDTPEAAMKMFMGMIQIFWLLPLIGFVETIGRILFTINKFRTMHSGSWNHG